MSAYLESVSLRDGALADPPAPSWRTAANHGAAISSSYLRSSAEQRYLLNKYRALLSRAREGLIIWVPSDDPNDPTREPARLDRMAAFLERAGLDQVSEEWANSGVLDQ